MVFNVILTQTVLSFYNRIEHRGVEERTDSISRKDGKKCYLDLKMCFVTFPQ